MDLAGIDVFAMPEFKHQERPDLVGIITSPPGVRIAHRFDHVCVEIASLPESRTQQGIPHHRIEGSAQARAERHGEAMLFPVHNVLRHPSIQQRLQCDLGCTSLELERSWEAHHELDKVLIEQRRPDFSACAMLMRSTLTRMSSTK